MNNAASILSPRVSYAPLVYILPRPSIEESQLFGYMYIKKMGSIKGPVAEETAHGS